ncbi:MAG: PstS family phosphate ABC transporter substrate-binding protein [Chloroflexi bacterium AL-W]|nr:PstS family phosphate ABC transporter substrate-binding protein [Chloroflexi bacterium AL-N10]NOK75001.1 PstS family phosphate ABC transporter substrate-binding protein [Chloroflexi bacterium AL-N5]NOK81788.1 PstS family phosphate ABC transporter substrate-binding protein [Chloroflexi bacterium AL-W]NOK89634.1 PstS family phosphate ABC transporter substrate-binding protein [Chloroflexi bacterium AL-N15]
MLITLKRQAALILLLVLVVPIIAACGGGGTTTEAPATEEAPAAEEATPEEEMPAEEATPEEEMPAEEATEEAPAAEEATPEEEATEEAPAEEASAEVLQLPDVDPATVEGDIITAGSSTVFPLAQRMADIFIEDGYAGNIEISSIGSGGGFERFCVSAETDISNASRAINDDEVAACQENGREPIEFRVGTDALAIVVNQENDFLEDVTADELRLIFSTAETWADVNPDWPAEPIERFIPGTDSGTFDYFDEEIFRAALEESVETGTPIAPFTQETLDALPPADDEGFDDAVDEAARVLMLDAANLSLSEDDNVLVQGVAANPFAIGFFGYAFFQQSEDMLRALSIDGVAPTAETAESNEYPLSRPLFIYSDAGIMTEKPQVASFINYFLTNVNDEVVEVGYFPASTEAINDAKQKWIDAVGE